LKGEIKGLLVFGEDPLSVIDNRKYFEGLEFLVVQDMFPTNTTVAADIILPAASFIEQEGSYMACDRRIQYINPFFESKTGMPNWQVIQSIAQKFNTDFAYDSIAGIAAEISVVNRFTKITKNEYFNGKGEPVFMMYDIDTTAYKPGLTKLLFSEQFFKNQIKKQLTR
jgi:predicted molibdopterin-dependent oxidoreductase YjgC